VWKLHLNVKSHDEDDKVYLLLDKLTINEDEYICHQKDEEHSNHVIESSINDISETIDDLVGEYLSHCSLLNHIPMKDMLVLKKAYNNYVRDSN